MDDTEYLFNERMYGGKRIARGAFAKKGGSRSKRCSLPSDKLTPKQLKERNGKVMSYNLNKPMSWKTFKSLDNETQSQYLYGLAHKYHARAKDVAEMFGLNRNYFSQWLHGKSWGKDIFPHTGRSSPHSEWLAFLARGDSEAAEATEDPDVSEPSEAPKNDDAPPVKVKLAGALSSADRGCVVYTGKPAAICERAYQLLDKDDEYTVTITFVKKKEDD